MYYERVFGVSPEVLTVHVDRIVSRGAIAMVGGPSGTWRSSDEDPIGGTWLVDLINDLFAIDGIEFVEVSRYSFTIYRGRLFRWGDIPEKVLSAIQVNVLSAFGDTEFISHGPPIRCFYNEEGKLQEIAIEDPDAPIPSTVNGELQPR